LTRILCLLLAAVAAGGAWAQNTNDPRYPSGPRVPSAHEKGEGELEEQQRREAAERVPGMPAWPKNENLIEFYVSKNSTFRFYIDAASLSVSPERIVRYTLIARSASGVVNLSYEGMRCAENQYRIYAYGRDGRWAVQSSEWREIGTQSMQRWHEELRSSYFCPKRRTIMSAAEGLDALRRGGHEGQNSFFGN
jgi:hypothetical protein